MSVLRIVIFLSSGIAAGGFYSDRGFCLDGIVATRIKLNTQYIPGEGDSLPASDPGAAAESAAAAAFADVLASLRLALLRLAPPLLGLQHANGRTR